MAQLPDWWNDVDQIMRQNGVPTRVWTAIAFAESTFQPWSSNLKPPDDSWGLFQLNRNGGQGAGYPSTFLTNPKNNATIAARYIGQAVRQCGADHIECIAVNSGHPGPVPTSDSRVQYIKSLYGKSSGMNAQEIFDTFTSGHGIPTAPIQTPSLPFDPTNPGSIPTDIGTTIAGGIASGIGDATKNFVTKFFGKWSDEMIQLYGPPAMSIAGGGLVIVGIIMAAMNTKVGQAAATAAVPGVTAGAIGARIGVAAASSARAITAPQPIPGGQVRPAPGVKAARTRTRAARIRKARP